MGRTVSSDLQDLLDLESCKTHTTLDLYLTDTSEFHFATDEFSIDGRDYTKDLVSADQLKQSISSSTNRVNVLIQNVDKVFGGIVANEDLIRSVAVLGRYYYDEKGVIDPLWVELFRGELNVLEVNEQQVQAEVVADLTAAGYCVSSWTLVELCQDRFKDPATCGYSGSETVCNKKRKSPFGCLGRDNEHRFNGMEFPDIQVPQPPIGGGGDGDPPDDPPPPHCPRVDQWLKIEGPEGNAIAIGASELKKEHLLWCPATQRFEEIDEVYIVRNVPIFFFEARNGCALYSSWSHMAMPHLDHPTGRRVDSYGLGQAVLTEKFNVLLDSVAAEAKRTGDPGDVIVIHMKGGHVYCAGATEGGFIVSHNKPINPDMPAFG